jgi:membrane-associated phospholipid phosphatase
MALTETATPTPASDGDEAGGPRPRRVLWMSVFAVGFLSWSLLLGLPTDYGVAFLWLWLATVAWNNHRTWREHWAFARDWLPIFVVLVVYDFSRGVADNLMSVHIDEMIHADRAMFGVVPTVWLQQHLYTRGDPQWWDVLVSFVYFSHFVVSLTIAVTLWLRARAVWVRFMRRWLFITGAGLVTYFLYPAAPPWYASKHGHIAETVYRTSSDGWHEIGLRSAGKLLTAGQVMSNPVAAMPSLHSAFAMLAVAFFFAHVGRRWIPVLLLYPLAMTFTLVYAGEHYVVDVLVGWTYVVIAFVVVGMAERWWRRRRVAGSRSELEVPAPVPEPVALGAAGEPVGESGMNPLR